MVMDEEGKCHDLQLIEEEIVEVEASIDDHEGENRNSQVLVGTLLTLRLFNTFTLKATMKGAWRLRHVFVLGN